MRWVSRAQGWNASGQIAAPFKRARPKIST
jgi:hypothetical protein